MATSAATSPSFTAAFASGFSVVAMRRCNLSRPDSCRARRWRYVHRAHVVFVEADRLPSCEARKTIWLPSVSEAATSSSPCSMLMAMIPRCITCEKSFTALFFTVHYAWQKRRSDFLLPDRVGKHRAYSLARLQANQMPHACLCRQPRCREFIHLEPIHASRVGENQM